MMAIHCFAAFGLEARGLLRDYSEVMRSRGRGNVRLFFFPLLRLTVLWLSFEIRYAVTSQQASKSSEVPSPSSSRFTFSTSRFRREWDFPTPTPALRLAHMPAGNQQHSTSLTRPIGAHLQANISE